MSFHVRINAAEEEEEESIIISIDGFDYTFDMQKVDSGIMLLTDESFEEAALAGINSYYSYNGSDFIYADYVSTAASIPTSAYYYRIIIDLPKIFSDEVLDITVNFGHSGGAITAGSMYMCNSTFTRVSSTYTALISSNRYLSVSNMELNGTSGNKLVIDFYNSSRSATNYQCVPINISVSSEAIDHTDDILEENNQLQQEQNQITNNIFGSIENFFGGFFENLINAIVGVFIPEDGFFEDFFSRLNDFFAEKLGMLWTPIDLLIDILTAIMNASDSDATLIFPELKYQEYVLIPETPVDIRVYLDEFEGLQEMMYFVSTLVQVGAVLSLLQNKLKEVLST